MQSREREITRSPRRHARRAPVALTLSALMVAAVATLAAPPAAEAGYVDAVLADGPLAYYRLDDGSSANGATAADLTGAHPGTYQGGTTQQQGPHGVPGAGFAEPNSTAADFNGTTSYVQLPTSLNSFGTSLNSFTIEFWVNTTTTALSRQLFGTIDNGLASVVAIDLNRQSNLSGLAGRTNFYVRDDSGAALSIHTAENIYDGQWHHVAWVMNDASANDTQIFIDGALASSATNTAGGPVNFANAFDHAMTLGAINNRGTISSHADAAVDEFALYTSALTPAQILAHVNALPKYLAAYDGSYAPNDATPPLTQTTWSVVDNSAAAGHEITPNAGGQIGFARFNDNQTGGRLSIFETIGATPIDDSAWRYEARLKIDALAGNPVFLGVRDEGGDGRIIMLGWNNAGQLGFYNNINGLVASVNSSNFIDGLFHEYEVLKFWDEVAGEFKVQVFIDGVAQFVNALDYDAIFPLDADANNGFGYFSSTPGTSDLTIDFMQLSTIPTPAALPAGLALLALGAVRRRRVC